MCKQDVQIGRKAGSAPPTTVAGTAGSTKVFGGNTNRFSVSIGLVPTGAVTLDGTAMLAGKIGGAYWPLAVVSLSNPGKVISIKETGDAILGEIWLVIGSTLANMDVVVGESDFDTTLNEV